jgi:hypothetical protein
MVEDLRKKGINPKYLSEMQMCDIEKIQMRWCAENALKFEIPVDSRRLTSEIANALAKGNSLAFLSPPWVAGAVLCVRYLEITNPKIEIEKFIGGRI